jgi:Flp pilus assembly pilin Flp
MNAGVHQEGASSVEYALLVAAVAGIVIAVLFVLGQVVHDGYKKTCDNLVEGKPTVTCPP